MHHHCQDAILNLKLLHTSPWSDGSQRGNSRECKKGGGLFHEGFESERAIGDVGIATAKRCIAFAKSKYEGGTNNIEELLKVS